MKRIAAIAQTVILVTAVTYIAWQLAGQWDELRRHQWELRAAPALLSAPLAAAWFLCRVWLWQRILAGFGYPLAYRCLFRTWVLSELSRYLPGALWHVFSRSHLSARQGVPTPVVLTGMLLELALVSVAAVAFLPLLGAGSRLVPALLGWAAGAGLLIVVFAHPRVLVPLVNAALRRFSRPTIAVRLGYGDLAAMLGLCALMWVCLSGGFALFAYALTAAAGSRPLAVAAAFPVAWFAGLIAVAAPGGLGVREGVLTALLALPLGAMAPVVALASRVWVTGIELLCAAAAGRIRE